MRMSIRYVIQQGGKYVRCNEQGDITGYAGSVQMLRLSRQTKPSDLILTIDGYVQKFGDH